MQSINDILSCINDGSLIKFSKENQVDKYNTNLKAELIFKRINEDYSYMVKSSLRRNFKKINWLWKINNSIDL